MKIILTSSSGHISKTLATLLTQNVIPDTVLSSAGDSKGDIEAIKINKYLNGIE